MNAEKKIDIVIDQQNEKATQKCLFEIRSKKN